MRAIRPNIKKQKMESNNQNLQTPITPTPIPLAAKRWYQHKGLLAIAILAVLIVVFSWIYFAKQPVTPIVNSVATQPTNTLSPAIAASTTPLPTGTSQVSGWKIYTNTELGFSFQYPPTYTITAASEHPGTIVHIQGPSSQPQLDVTFENFNYDSSIEKINTTIAGNSFSNFLVSANDDRYFYNLHGKELLFWFYFPQNQLLPSGASENPIQQFAQQILTTFSLTTNPQVQPLPSSDQATAGWKTYSNSNYSVAMSYPSDFIAYDNLHDAGSNFYAYFDDASSGPPKETPYDVYVNPGSVLLTIGFPSMASPCDSSNPLNALAFCTQETINSNTATVEIVYQPAENDPTYKELSAIKIITFQNKSFQYDLTSMIDPVVSTSSLQSETEIQQSEKSLASQIFDVDRMATTFSFPK
jgi:hypothetical protein